MPSDTDVPSRSQIQPRYMDINDKDIASFVSALENQESEKRATLKERLLSNSPVVVYDWSEKTVEVRSKKNVEYDNVYQIIKFPAGSERIWLYLDEETGSRITTEVLSPNGISNDFRINTFLDKVPHGSALRFFHVLLTLYVINADALRRDQSR